MKSIPAEKQSVPLALKCLGTNVVGIKVYSAAFSRILSSGGLLHFDWPAHIENEWLPSTLMLSPPAVWTHSRLTIGMDRECFLFSLLFFTLMNQIASMRSIKEEMIKYACDLKGQFSHKWKPHMTYGTTFMVIFHPFLKLDRASFHWLSLYGNKKQPRYSSEIEQKIESHMGLESPKYSKQSFMTSEMENLLKIYFKAQVAS